MVCASRDKTAHEAATNPVSFQGQQNDMPPRKILIAGLGRFISDDPQGAAKFGPQQSNIRKLQETMAKAREDGYDVSNIDVNPKDAEDSIERLEAELERQKWDLLIIGFGIRGNKDFTELFEKVVNAAIGVQPTIRFGFSRAPDEVYETMKRVLTG